MNRRLQLHEGTGKGKGKGKRDRVLWPIAWEQLSENQKRYVRNFRNGRLKAAKEAAEAEYGPRSAETNIFRLD